MDSPVKPVVIAVANEKGGVGKTTVARELGGCLALRGFRCLLIDCDTQMYLTRSLVDTDQFPLNLAHVLVTPVTDGDRQGEPLALARVIIETAVPNLDLVGASKQLKGFDHEPDESVYLLREQIREHCGGYDFVIMDCPPHYGRLQRAALYASRYVIVPCAALFVGMEGLEEIGETVRRIRRAANPDLSVLGVVITLFKARRSLAVSVREAVERSANEHGLGRVFGAGLNDLAPIAEAPSKQIPVALYAPRSLATRQLDAFTDEVLVGLQMPLRAQAMIVGGEASEEESRSELAAAASEGGVSRASSDTALGV